MKKYNLIKIFLFLLFFLTINANYSVKANDTLVTDESVKKIGFENPYKDIDVKEILSEYYDINSEDELSDKVRSIIGTDDRQTIADKYNWNGVAIVLFEDSNGNKGNGTAFYIGNGRFATAAHVIFNPYTKQLNRKFVIIPGAMGVSSAEWGTYTPKTYFMHYKYFDDVTTVGYKPDYDYGYFQIETSDSNMEQFNKLKVHEFYAPSDWQFLDYVSAGNMLYAIGYPDERQYYRYRVKSNGGVYGYNNQTFRFSADTSGGMSGGPIVINRWNWANPWKTIGIIVSETKDYNVAIRITPEVIDFMKS